MDPLAEPRLVVNDNASSEESDEEDDRERQVMAAFLQEEMQKIINCKSIFPGWYTTKDPDAVNEDQLMGHVIFSEPDNLYSILNVYLKHLKTQDGNNLFRSN